MFSESKQIKPPGRCCSHPETSEREFQRLRTVHLRPAAQQVVVGLSYLKVPCQSGGREWGAAKVNLAVERRTWWSSWSDMKALEPMVSKWRMSAQPGSHLSFSGNLKGRAALRKPRMWRERAPKNHCLTPLLLREGTVSGRKGRKSLARRPLLICSLA